ncbi:uncharacterized protein LOC127742836 [Arachis duranensis]|uniref:Uncharacterized protein LOC127742836 n=1 Tax=Arachis duranensis TaxID=130453 RepID=A0A9C6WIX8_ARADU|nr:uncharacterized protein LOC127742836 [Arachis duranensis]
MAASVLPPSCVRVLFCLLCVLQCDRSEAREREVKVRFNQSVSGRFDSSIAVFEIGVTKTRSTFLASPLSQSHSATLLLPLIELLLTPSLLSLWPLNEHTEERREDRRELERSLEEALKQPSLVTVPQHPATAAATASARRRPCSPPICLLFGQLLRLFFGQPLFELRSPLFSPLRRVFEPLFSLCSAAFQPLFRHCLPPFSHLRRDLKLLPFPVLLEFQNCSILRNFGSRFLQMSHILLFLVM